MARVLRIERRGGRYHVTARGNERKEIHRDDTGGLDYAVVSKAIACFGRRLSLGASLREELAAIQRHLSK